MKKLAVMLSIVFAVVFLAACGNEEPVSEKSGDLAAYAGEYVFYGTYINDYYVMIEDLEGTTTSLKADGTGYLYWGKNNEKPVTEWSVTENNIRVTAGEDTLYGLVKDGVLILNIGDQERSFLECYVTKEADTSDMPQITAEEWAEKIFDTIE